MTHPNPFDPDLSNPHAAPPGDAPLLLTRYDWNALDSLPAPGAAGRELRRLRRQADVQAMALSLAVWASQTPDDLCRKVQAEDRAYEADTARLRDAERRAVLLERREAVWDGLSDGLMRLSVWAGVIYLSWDSAIWAGRIVWAGLAAAWRASGW